MTLTDAERERIIDRRVQQRLATDRAYNHADNAEEQSAREEQITAEEEQRLGPKRLPLASPDTP